MNQADEAWVQKLYRYNAPKLYKVVLRRLEDAEAAQDIVQEAFLALIEKIELVKCHPNPVGWLMKAGTRFHPALPNENKISLFGFSRMG